MSKVNFKLNRIYCFRNEVHEVYFKVISKVTTMQRDYCSSRSQSIYYNIEVIKRVRGYGKGNIGTTIDAESAMGCHSALVPRLKALLLE